MNPIDYGENEVIPGVSPNISMILDEITKIIAG